VDDFVRRRGDFGQPTALAVRRYKLNATLSAGGSAAAYWVIWDKVGAAYIPCDGTGGHPSDSFTLYSGPNNFTGVSGDFGYAAYFPDRGKWEAIGGGGGAVAIGTLGATLNQGSNATFTFVVGGSGTATVYDAVLCSGDSVANGTTIVVAKIAGQWYLINAVCACV
jgi:hypothetical protein